jgi:hypothetical protein
MTAHVSTAPQDEQARPVPLQARLLRDQVRGQLVIELVDVNIASLQAVSSQLSALSQTKDAGRRLSRHVVWLVWLRAE